MQLVTLLSIPFAGAILSLVAERAVKNSARIVALITAVVMGGATYAAWMKMPTNNSGYFLWESFRWIPSAGIRVTLGIDAMSWLLIALTALLLILSVACSWTYIKEKSGAFYFCLLWVSGGTVGVFLAHDLFLFYFFWEMMLIPMYFLIGVWGHENRVYAAIKFFLFTFISGLFLLAALLGLYWLHGEATGIYTFDYNELLKTPLTLSQQTWILAGLFIGFAVKLPAFGVHTWLPDAHTEAPTAGSIILAGILLKTGAYGLIRFALAFCPEAVAQFAWYGALIGVIGIFYGAIMAFTQTDLKRLVAYSSVSHMGFVLLAIAANNVMAGQGAIMQMICHGLSTGALFAIVGMIDQRYHTRSMEKLGGLWNHLPRLSGFLVFFTMASLGFPGLGNFIAELLSLLGAYPVWPALSIAGAIGLFFAAIYSLKFLAKSVYGPLKAGLAVTPDLSLREWAILVPLGALLLFLGLKPGPTLKLTEGYWQSLQQPAATVEVAKRELR